MKILIQHKSLIIGGVEKSLISFIENLKKENIIDLFLFNKAGGLVENLSKDVNVLNSNKYLKMLNGVSSENNSKNKFLFVVKRIFFKLIKFFGGKKIISNLALKKQERIEKNYDVAICFHGLDSLSLKFVLQKTTANLKFAFIHADVSKIKISNSTQKLLKKFDKIVCVSNSCAKIFKNKFPILSHKVDFLYNFQNPKQIVKQSKMFKPDFSKKTFNIVSISRLAPEKAYLRTLQVLKELKDEGFKFCYHIVGGGESKIEIEKFINKNRLNDCVILYGKQSNPYPYIKKADMLLLGSYHESFGIVLVESMILKTPVLSTKTCSSKEIIEDRGIICDNSIDGLKKALKYVLKNKEKLNVYKENLKNFGFDNKANKKKFESLCE